MELAAPHFISFSYLAARLCLQPPAAPRRVGASRGEGTPTLPRAGVMPSRPPSLRPPAAPRWEGKQRSLRGQAWGSACGERRASPGAVRRGAVPRRGGHAPAPQRGSRLASLAWLWESAGATVQFLWQVCPMDLQGWRLGNVRPLPANEPCDGFVGADTGQHLLPLAWPSVSSGMVPGRVLEPNAAVEGL